MTLSASSADTPTHELRWLDVGGMKPILQQKWVLTTESTDKRVAPSREEVWRDVPTVQKKR